LRNAVAVEKSILLHTQGAEIMKTNIVMLAFASVFATTATDWAVGADSAAAQSESSFSSDDQSDNDGEKLMTQTDRRKYAATAADGWYFAERRFDSAPAAER
jgi:hypothetical protein